MKYKFGLRYLVLLFLLLITSCSGDSRDIDKLISEKVDDDFEVLHIVEKNDMQFAFFERNTLKDIGMVFTNNTYDKSKTSVHGYLSQKSEDPAWHYSSTEMENKTYSIYFGRLDDQPSGKIIIKLNNQKLEQEAILFEASKSTIWVIAFNERIEDTEISIVFQEKSN